MQQSKFQGEIQKLHMQQNAPSNPLKCTSSTWLNTSLDSADEGQNWDTVMFLVTTLEMMLTGVIRKSHFPLEFNMLTF